MKSKSNPYGYKLCYKEEGTKDYVRYFKTYTYRQAVTARKGFVRFPPSARANGRKLQNPKWVIIPIKHSEIRAGIWREDPFPPLSEGFFLFIQKTKTYKWRLYDDTVNA